MDALVDANVWVPILLGSHPHHAKATAWWDKVAPGEATWCRFTQDAVLRLLTNTHVMAGAPLTPDAAWIVWQQLALDVRTTFRVGEPIGVDSLWQNNVRGRTTTPKLWTDAYLAALAEASHIEMVTFDKGFQHFQLTYLRLLSV